MRTLITFAILSVLLAACGTGSRGGAPEALPASAELAGIWRFTEEITSAQGDCEPDMVGQQRSATFEIEVVGPNTISITNLTKPEISPTEVHIDGDQSNWGWYQTVGEIIADEQGQGSFSGATFTGTTTWSETDVAQNISCFGTSDMVGVRLHPAPVDEPREGMPSPGATDPIERF